MSQTYFDSVIRSALWTSYNCTCFYCSKAVDWTDVHLDHIIPESIINTPLTFEKLKLDYGLVEDFDINGLQNLVPAHAKCNLRKSDELFSKKTTLYYLELTKSKHLKIKTEIETLQKRKNKGKIISRLQSALATGLIDIDELNRVLEVARKKNWNSLEIKLPYAIEFIDEAYELFYLNQDYSSLLDKTILFGGVYDFIEVTNVAEDVVKISTLRQWKHYTNKGYFPKTNADIKMSSAVTNLEELLDALNKAKMPKMSFISEPWVEISDLYKLSPALIQDFEGKLSEYISKGISIGELVDQGIIKKRNSDRYQVSLAFEGFETSIREQFRADFNDDGIEDILVQGWVRAIGGTLGFSFSSILTRYSHKHLFEIAKL